MATTWFLPGCLWDFVLFMFSLTQMFFILPEPPPALFSQPWSCGGRHLALGKLSFLEAWSLSFSALHTPSVGN